MSTTYPIEEVDFYSLEITEQSGKFDVELFDTISGETCALNDLTIEQLVKIGVKILKIASYNANAHELQGLINTHINNSGGYTIGIAL